MLVSEDLGDPLLMGRVRVAVQEHDGNGGYLAVADGACGLPDGRFMEVHQPLGPVDPALRANYAIAGERRPIGRVMSNSFGFGGHNVCLAVKRWDS